MPGGVRDDHGFKANTGDKDVQPVAEGYSGGGQTRDLFSIIRKFGLLGCLLPLLCSACGLLGGVAMFDYEWISYTLENGYDPEIAWFLWVMGVQVLVLVAIAAIPIILRKRRRKAN